MVREEATDGSLTKTDAKIRKEWEGIEIRFLFGPQSAQRKVKSEISFILVLSYK